MMCVLTAIFPDEFRKNVSLSFTASLSANSLLDEMEEWQLRLQAKMRGFYIAALHDPLAGLANRAAFRSGINTLMNNSDAEKRRRYYCDGDNFVYQ